ncbi:hypothetical protein T02_10287 [Trichinella nativa]|uniref:Uncharacterized protein n=1 Tax=Trichinella nativa TaxID=6335 RepID=A0A0V1L0P3_9BILA|nr:hypothetical protein T02_10287 [Trichinella nativa]
MSNENIDVIDVPNESLLLNLIPLFVRLNTEDKLYRILMYMSIGKCSAYDYVLRSSLHAYRQIYLH